MSSTTSKRERQKARRAERQAAERAAAKRRQAGRRVRLGIIVVVAVVAVVGIAWLMVRGADATLGVPAAEASGDPLVPFRAEPGATDPAAGTQAPAVSGHDPDGGEVALGTTGRAQAVSFLAHWCPHCQEEVPEVVAWAGEGNLPDAVDLVAVSTYHDPARPNWPPDDWLEQEGWPGAVLVDHDTTVAEAYGAVGTPFWVFIDADGNVAARHSGRLTLDQLDGYVGELVDG